MNTVLIVEDEKMIRQGIKIMVQRSGVPVNVIIECSNGQTALEILQNQEVDVMFTDIRMPKMDGIELVASQPGDWDRMVSMDVATAMINANPDLKAIYACNDVEALGVVEAVINANKLGEILVVGTDATADGKNSIAKGEETASVGQDNEKIGIESVKSAIEAVKSGFVPKDHVGDVNYPVITYIDSFLVDSSNVADYMK